RIALYEDVLMPDELEAVQQPGSPQLIEMPRSTAGPMIVGASIVLLCAGIALSPALSIVGAIIFAVGLATWIGQLLPGGGHAPEPRVPPSHRPQQIPPAPGMVEQMQEGMPGYRMRLPLKVHPISAGVKGGLLGGLLMPIPALLWGLVSRHGIWYPINLLAGMINPSVGNLPVAELERFLLGFLLVGLVIHAIMWVVIGLIYGVLLPTLPPIRGGQIIWGGVVLPLLWTGASYGLMGVTNPLLQRDVDWPWFI